MAPAVRNAPSGRALETLVTVASRTRSTASTPKSTTAPGSANRRAGTGYSVAYASAISSIVKATTVARGDSRCADSRHQIAAAVASAVATRADIGVGSGG